MSKAALISIRPEWCEKIMTGQKTIEVRKTRPKMNPPFKCYVYRTKGTVPHIINGEWVQMEVGGTVVGEFTCDAITRVNICGFWDDSGKQLDNRLRETCLTSKEFCDYLGEKVGFGWHISNLKIYDHPRDLWEFTGLRETKFGLAPGPITRPPQSWRYVEEEIWRD